MRGGSWSIQQALTAEAAMTLKQSVGLARRRGHAQVTPLHVASTMLSSSPGGLLRSACLHSHSCYPLQCKALELCFNVALNRLPATSSPPLIHHSPTLSNALIAAFKRAQAHQRRGLLETQQPPLLTLKIALHQLILSILDDPSVSRVMREAGFSSTQVKINVEQAISNSEFPNAKSLDHADSQVGFLLESLAQRKKTSLVVLGETLSASEAAVNRVMDIVNAKRVPEELPQNLRGLQFIPIFISAFVNLNMDEVQHKVSELRLQLKGFCLERTAAVLYLKDLNWAAEYWTGCGEKLRASSAFCPVQAALKDIVKLIFGGVFAEEVNTIDLWLLSTASYRDFMRCRAGNPSLETLLSLHPVTIPAGSFILSLSNHEIRQNGTFLKDGPLFQSEANPSSSISCNKLPSWLKVLEEEKRRENINNLDSESRDKNQNFSSYWSFMEKSSRDIKNQRLERTLSFLSASPPPPPPSEQSQFGFSCIFSNWPISAPTSRVCSPEHDHEKALLPEALLNHMSASSSPYTMDTEYVPRFKELSAHNLKVLCNVLEREITPLHKNIIPDIASTILQCRSGILNRKERSFPSRKKEDTWLLFKGNDCESKVKISQELASVIFGSRSKFTFIELESTVCFQNKRIRAEKKRSFAEQFFVSLRENPHSVIMVEDAEELDLDSQICIKEVIERGGIQGFEGEDALIGDSIIILSCKSLDFRSRASSPSSVKQKKIDIGDKNKEEGCDHEISSNACFDLNISSEEELQSLKFVASDDDDVGLLKAVDKTFILQSS